MAGKNSSWGSLETASTRTTGTRSWTLLTFLETFPSFSTLRDKSHRYKTPDTDPTSKLMVVKKSKKRAVMETARAETIKVAKIKRRWSNAYSSWGACKTPLDESRSRDISALEQTSSDFSSFRSSPWGESLSGWSSVDASKRAEALCIKAREIYHDGGIDFVKAKGHSLYENPSQKGNPEDIPWLSKDSKKLWAEAFAEDLIIN